VSAAAAIQDRPDRPIRLAVLLQDLEYGGTQRYAVELLRRLDRSLFTPELWLLNSGAAMEAEARGTGAPVVRVSDRPPGCPLALPPLYRRIAAARPDLLYTLTVVPNIWGRLFGRMAGVPAVASGYRALSPGQWESLLWRLSDRVICNAGVLRERVVAVHGADPERVAVVPNSVDLERFRPASGRGEVPVVLSVARLVPDKSPLTLVEAFALVRRELPPARLVMVGEGPLLPQVRARLAELRLDDAVEIVGGCGDARPHLARAQVFVLASQREGSPNAVLEAMACGLPVVASRVGGIPELVEDGRTGLLAAPGTPEDFARHLLRLLRDPGLCARMGQAGRQRAEAGHSPEAVTRATERELLTAWARRGGQKSGRRRA
jgi:glycosyltransferase involved in cell wall biosynthesis